MLKANETYETNGGVRVTIGGRIKEYSPEKPFVWSIAGNWYHEETGQYVSYRVSGTCGVYDLLDKTANSSLRLSQNGEISLKPQNGEIWKTKSDRYVLIVNNGQFVWYDEIDKDFSVSKIESQLAEKTNFTIADWGNIIHQTHIRNKE